MELIVDQLLNEPSVKLYLDEVHDALRREDAARKRFYALLPTPRRIEFINGEVVQHMPLNLSHVDAIRRIYGPLSLFVQARRLGKVAAEQAMTRFSRNDYGPDICFWPRTISSRFDAKSTVFPVPAFAVEVLSPSSVERDTVLKYKDYAAHGVEEYWIVDPIAEQAQQHVLSNGKYTLSGGGSKGVLKTKVIKGFNMPVRAIFDDAANARFAKQLLRV
jgi:Uma2 family endonuclease